MLKMRCSLVVFAGPVGAGKSTQIVYLQSALRKIGVRNKSVFLKSGHLLAYILELFLAKVVSKRSDVAPLRALYEDSPRLFKRVFKLWLFFDLLSVTVKFLLTIYVPFKFRYTIIVEEYIPATIADYFYLSNIAGRSLSATSFPVRYLLRLMNICRPVCVVYLDAENAELRRRWKVRKSLEEKEDYLLMQRTLLLRLYKTLADIFVYENTQLKRPREVFRSVISALLQ